MESIGLFAKRNWKWRRNNLKVNAIHEFYLLTLQDIDDGATKQELLKIVEMYEQQEMYEACAGMMKAIKESYD